MPTHSGPNTAAERNIVFSYDVGDVTNSYQGEPTTNRIPSPGLNSYPTYGNGWGTYNTNQYCGNNGCGAFWDIPAIASVSNNIVTTVSAHPMRSFDVLQPATTGGGLTANTNYLVKKISSTQFSLHAYNGSQDGSQGYINPSTNGFKVHDSYWLDQRISVNATNFPTSWWGYPHLPNSAIVKEIISGGFDLPGNQATDCIRLHWFRTDATDGMAYGVDPYVEIGQQVTVSFYARAASPSAVGQSIGFQNYNYGGPGGYSYFSMTATWGKLGEWVKNSYTFTVTHNYLISYWFPSAGGIDVDIANIQVEQKPHATQFVPGTRSVSGSLLPLIGNSTLDLSNVSFNSAAQITFDGTNDKIVIPDNAIFDTNIFTIETICKLNTFDNAHRTVISHNAAVYSHTNGWWIGTLRNGLGNGNNDFRIFFWGDSSYVVYNTANGGNDGNYHHLVASCDGNNIFFYVDRQLVYSTTKPTGNIYTSGQDILIGNSVSDDVWSGEIPIVKIYNTVLSADQIKQNYKQYKSRFNLS
jgi:hypothetical protein